MKISNLGDVPSMSVDMEGAFNVTKQVPVSREDGAPNFSFRVFTIGPGGHTPWHTHEAEHANYVIQGRGVLVDESGGGREVEAGDFVLVLPNEKHQYRNASSTEPLVMICAVPTEYE